MDPDRWRQIEQLYQAALERGEHERAAFLHEACAGDESLEHEIESLLTGSGETEDFLEMPALELEARALAQHQIRSGGRQLIDSIPMIGSIISHYELLEKLGEGGMGEVFKAHDKRLDRIVALKFLGIGRIADPEQERRLVKEARTASSFHHPNVAHIYAIDKAVIPRARTPVRSARASPTVTHFIAMEYVPGTTLAQIISAGRLNLRDTLKLAAQIADALAAAHRAGIVHRDLKPGNIMVDETGVVKVLDFGLAKLINLVPNPDSNDQTIQHTTQEGVIQGTVSYMSPEQAEGKPLDARSDIFSFGAVLYEIVAGRQAFRGDTTISTISSILRDEPQPASEFAPNIPHDLETIINRCLRKDPAKRFQTMADVRVALVEVKEELESVRMAANRATRKRRDWRWIAGACIVGALATAAGLRFYIPLRSPQPELRIEPLASYSGFQRDPAFSPDGNQVAFAWTGLSGTVTHIYVKIIGTDTPLQLTSGDMPDAHPAWAPDGKSIAFLRALSPTSSGIYQIAPLGGAERHIADVTAGLYPLLSWSHDGKWLVTTGRQGLNRRSQIFIVSTGRGELRPLSFGDKKDEFYPALSLNSRFLAFSRMLGYGDWGIFVVPLNDDLQPQGAPRRISTPFGLNREPAWMPNSKEIVFASGGTVTTRLWRASASRESPARQLPATGEVAYQPAIAPGGIALPTRTI